MDQQPVLNIMQDPAYSMGAVVSRSILKKPNGNITLFAFDAGEGLSEHTAPFDAFLLVPEGSAEVTVGGILHTLGAGDSVILPARVPHSVRGIEAFRMLLVMIKDQA